MTGSHNGIKKVRNMPRATNICTVLIKPLGIYLGIRRRGDKLDGCYVDSAEKGPKKGRTEERFTNRTPCTYCRPVTSRRRLSLSLSHLRTT